MSPTDQGHHFPFASRQNSQLTDAMMLVIVGTVRVLARSLHYRRLERLPVFCGSLAKYVGPPRQSPTASVRRPRSARRPDCNTFNPCALCPAITSRVQISSPPRHYELNLTLFFLAAHAGSRKFHAVPHHRLRSCDINWARFFWPENGGSRSVAWIKQSTAKSIHNTDCPRQRNGSESGPRFAHKTVP